MRLPVRVSMFLALSLALGHPAAASCDGTVGHAHPGVDPTETSCVTLDAVMAGDIAVTEAWARAMLPGQPAGAGFLTLENKGGEADRLVSVSTDAAGRAEIHTMEVVDDVMVMRPVDAGLEIAPGETVKLEPGGMHLMFFDVAAPFTEGDTVIATLTFEKAGPVAIELPVAKASPGGHLTH